MRIDVFWMTGGIRRGMAGQAATRKPTQTARPRRTPASDLYRASQRASRSREIQKISGFLQWVEGRGEVPGQVPVDMSLERKIKSLTLHSVVTPQEGEQGYQCGGGMVGEGSRGDGLDVG